MQANYDPPPLLPTLDEWAIQFAIVYAVDLLAAPAAPWAIPVAVGIYLVARYAPRIRSWIERRRQVSQGRAVPEGDLLTIRELAAESGISRQAVQTRMRRQAVPTTKVVRDGRTCILVRRVDADAAGLTRPRTAGGAPAEPGIAEAFAAERAKVDRMSQEIGRLAAELAAEASLREQSAWLQKSTERRCDKLEQKIEDRDREIADLRSIAMLRDSEIARLRQDRAILSSRPAVPLLGGGDAPSLRGWLARLFGR
jgi:hypothetical protein